MGLVKKYFNKFRTSRYLIVGLTVYLLEILVIFIVQKLWDNEYLAVGLSFWIGLVVSFGLQKFITFQDHRKQKKIIATQFLAVCLLVIWNFIFTLIVTKILKNHASPFVSRTLALGITTIWNYYLYKTRIFKASEIELID